MPDNNQLFLKGFQFKNVCKNAKAANLLAEMQKTRW